MSAKSTRTKYGSIAITIHWIMAILILVLLGSGFRAASTVVAEAKATILLVHAPVGISVLVLLILRIVWWLFFDKKPNEIGGQPRWQEVSAKAVHYSFYGVLFLMTASGVGMFILSGAGPILFGGGTEALPDFDNFAPRVPHGLGARLLIALVVLHAGAALYHQFIRKDGLLSRMWFGRDQTKKETS